MLTEKDYCDYETCVALKELEYPTKMTFIGEQATIEIPINSGLISLYEAQKWLREEKRVIVVIVPYTYNLITETSTWTYEIWLEDNLERQVHDFKTYEDALSEGVKEAVKILKEKEDE